MDAKFFINPDEQQSYFTRLVSIITKTKVELQIHILADKIKNPENLSSEQQQTSCGRGHLS